MDKYGKFRVGQRVRTTCKYKCKFGKSFKGTITDIYCDDYDFLDIHINDDYDNFHVVYGVTCDCFNYLEIICSDSKSQDISAKDIRLDNIEQNVARLSQEMHDLKYNDIFNLKQSMAQIVFKIDGKKVGTIEVIAIIIIFIIITIFAIFGALTWSGVI